MKFDIEKFLKSFWFASQGLIRVSKERNFRFHIFATLVVIVASFYYRLNLNEWIVVLLCIGAVTSAEVMNTAIEETCNLLNEKLKLEYLATYHARNLAAASVFIIAIISAIIALLIFLPKIV